jgi:hypothetical protein
VGSIRVNLKSQKSRLSCTAPEHIELSRLAVANSRSHGLKGSHSQRPKRPPGVAFWRKPIFCSRVRRNLSTDSARCCPQSRFPYIRRSAPEFLNTSTSLPLLLFSLFPSCTNSCTCNPNFINQARAEIAAIKLALRGDIWCSSLRFRVPSTSTRAPQPAARQLSCSRLSRRRRLATFGVEFTSAQPGIDRTAHSCTTCALTSSTRLDIFSRLFLTYNTWRIVQAVDSAQIRSSFAMDANDASSPGSLSSPPHSPEQGTPNATIRVSGGVVGVSTPTPANGSSPAPRLTASGQPRKKPGKPTVNTHGNHANAASGPKPRAKEGTAAPEEKKARKPRKPAEPKDTNAQPVQRKRRTKASLDAQASPSPQAADEKPPTQSPAPQTRPAEPVAAPQAEQPQVVSHLARMSSNPEPTLHSNPNLSHISVAPSTPRPSSSGQRYDPIRGGVFESKPQAPASAPPPPMSPPLNRASASPSITSLIDPPSASNTFYSHPVKLQQQPSVSTALFPFKSAVACTLRLLRTTVT